MSIQRRLALRENVRDLMVVSSFGFWAVMIGFVPAVAIRALLA